MEKDRVKIIRNIREEQLQVEVNAFIEKNSCRVRKIMFQQAALGSYMSYSAMIYYEKVDLALLTEGQDEQNELWEDVIDCINSNDDPIAATNILKQSFTIKRK